MLGLGAFSAAADVTAFQMFQQDQPLHGRGGSGGGGGSGYGHRSVSPWTRPISERRDDQFQLPAQTSSRLSDQYTPQEYTTATKLQPRQLQWTASHTLGYDSAPAAALCYDVDQIQSGGLHFDVRQPFPSTTSATGWTRQFTQSVPGPNLASAECSGSQHLPQTFHEPPSNYYADCPLERTDSDVTRQLVCGRGQFSGNSSVMTCPPSVQNCSSYPTQSSSSSNSYNGSAAKSDRDTLSEWQCSSLAWHQSEPFSKPSLGQQTACPSTTSPQPSTTTLPYQESAWATTCDQKPVKITPSMSIGKTRTRDKYRTVYTEKQRLELEAEYERSTYITSQRKASISAAVGLSERQVKIWFQNRRAKDRKQRRRRTAKSQAGKSETETGSAIPDAIGAGPAEFPEHKFLDSTVFYDPRMIAATSHPTYFSAAAR